MSKARLIDLVATAGFMVRTRSWVLHGDCRVATVTRARVRQALCDLNFEVDAVTQSQRAGTDTGIDHFRARLRRMAARRLPARMGDPALPIEHLRLDTPPVARGSGELRP